MTNNPHTPQTDGPTLQEQPDAVAQGVVERAIDIIMDRVPTRLHAEDAVQKLATAGLLATPATGAGELEKYLLDLPCERQHQLAALMAENVGSKLVSQPPHPDTPTDNFSTPPASDQRGADDEADAQMLARLKDDAGAWAAQFRNTAIKLGYSDMDEGWLISWFANAIVTGQDIARRSAAPAQAGAVEAMREACAKCLDQMADDADAGLSIRGNAYRKAANVLRSLPRPAADRGQVKEGTR